MNWFSMLFLMDSFRKITVTILRCFVTSFFHENDWHVFPKYLFQKNWTHKLSNYVTFFWMNEFKIFSQFTFLSMVTDFVVQLHLYINWSSMLFQIHFFIKIINCKFILIPLYAVDLICRRNFLILDWYRVVLI